MQDRHSTGAIQLLSLRAFSAHFMLGPPEISAQQSPNEGSPMPSNITIFGAPLNNLLHIAAGLEAVGITHQLPEDDAPAGAVLNATDRLRAKVMALHAELSVCATYWAEDGAEGIEGAEPLSNGDEDDAGEEWQGE